MKAAVLIAAFSAALATTGCVRDPPACDLDERLDGIWAGGDRRYHVVERSGGVEIVALGDSRGGLDRAGDGARSASYARLERRGGRLEGHGQQFRAEGDRVCRVRWPISGRCSEGRLVLEIAEPGAVSFADCSQAPPAAGHRLVLARVRAL